MGLGFLSKYTNLFQLLCWALFFLLWPPARKHLRRPGPWLAIGVILLCFAPPLIWNIQNDWISAKHVASDGELGKKWEFTLRYMGEFLGAEFGLLNPVFFVGMIRAAIAFWRKDKVSTTQPHLHTLELFLFAMGAPVFVFYFLFSLHSRVLPNWIAPSVLPLFCLMVVHFGRRWDKLGSKLLPWVVGGTAVGMFVVVIAHNTNLVGRLVGHPLPPHLDVLARARGWDDLARTVRAARKDLEQREGKPAFVIGEHYGFTSLVSFYDPEAQAASQPGTEALVYALWEPRPSDQFYYWPSYRERKGQNAIYIRKIERKKLDSGWFQAWLKDGSIRWKNEPETFQNPPKELFTEFESVREIGVKDVCYQGRIMRRVQLFECHHLE
jgi:hypothetical protein